MRGNGRKRVWGGRRVGKFPYKPRAAEEGERGCIVNAELGWINHNSENSLNPRGQTNFYFPGGGIRLRIISFPSQILKNLNVLFKFNLI